MKTLLLARHVQKAVRDLIQSGARRAECYVTPQLVVSAARVTFGKRPSRGGYRYQIALKIGQPNFLERKFVVACKKAHEPFPVRKTHLRHYREAAA